MAASLVSNPRSSKPFGNAPKVYSPNPPSKLGAASALTGRAGVNRVVAEAKMPFTPFHFGPAAAFKAAAPAHFSFTIFCYSQVVTDLETAFYLFRGEYPVHRFFHTFIGATLVGLACALTGRPGCEFALRIWQRSVSIPSGVAFVSAFLGTYSHVFLDSIMHRDTMPFSPFSTSNPMLRIVSAPLLEFLCLAFGMLGVLILSFRLRTKCPPA
jgi:hypothetical protein